MDPPLSIELPPKETKSSERKRFRNFLNLSASGQPTGGVGGKRLARGTNSATALSSHPSFASVTADYLLSVAGANSSPYRPTSLLSGRSIQCKIRRKCLLVFNLQESAAPLLRTSGTNSCRHQLTRILCWLTKELSDWSRVALHTDWT